MLLLLFPSSLWTQILQGVENSRFTETKYFIKKKKNLYLLFFLSASLAALLSGTATSQMWPLPFPALPGALWKAQRENEGRLFLMSLPEAVLYQTKEMSAH
jgi:hypothetical protein